MGHTNNLMLLYICIIPTHLYWFNNAQAVTDKEGKYQSNKLLEMSGAALKSTF